MTFKIVTTFFEDVCKNLQHNHLEPTKYFKNQLFQPFEDFVCKENENVSAIEWAAELLAPNYLFEDNSESDFYFYVINELKKSLENYKIYIFFDMGYSQSKIHKHHVSKGAIKYFKFENMDYLERFTEILMDKDSEIYGCGFLDITEMPQKSILPYLIISNDKMTYMHCRTIIALPNNISNSIEFPKCLKTHTIHNKNTLIGYALKNHGITIDRYNKWHTDDPYYSFIGAGNIDLMKMLHANSTNSWIEFNKKIPPFQQ